MTKVDEIKKELKKRGVIYSYICSPFIQLSQGYIRILRTNTVDIISQGNVFDMSYDELSDLVLDKILNNLKNV